jgi:hypothetical protein
MHSDLGSDNSENEMSVEEVNIKIKQKHKNKQKLISMIKTMAGTSLHVLFITYYCNCLGRYMQHRN